MALPSGNKFVGEYKFDKQIKGTTTWVNGKKYVGEINGSEFHGYGILTLPDGTVKKGTWNNGKLQNDNNETAPVHVAKTPTQDDEIISASSGSGFAVSSDGYVITNHHVIEGCVCVFCWKTAGFVCFRRLDSALDEWHSETEVKMLLRLKNYFFLSVVILALSGCVVGNGFAPFEIHSRADAAGIKKVDIEGVGVVEQFSIEPGCVESVDEIGRSDGAYSDCDQGSVRSEVFEDVWEAQTYGLG